MATHSTAFGALLRHFRGRAYMTQAKLAERAGLSLDAVNKLERGERQAPRCDTVHVLARALQPDPQDRRTPEDAACPPARAPSVMPYSLLSAALLPRVVSSCARTGET